ncbi:MAG: LLM class flavin-dependent oxidoreductase [Alphaproteobacteria bacterium]|nr:LLM class flavin-dependent oxidoreductase [Alphaproteobacteria bacterium]
MQISVVTFLRPGSEPTGRSLDRIVDYARQVEGKDFRGLWVTDSFGRGRPTLDPLVALGALAAVTRKVELGTCVLQIPVRHPVELAHRIQSLQALSGGRLQLGVGSGSTQADFDLVGADYTQRFKMLMSSLDIMRRAWRGERLEGGALTPWPGTEGGPPVMLGAWRNMRWITYAAEQCAGWIASGLYGSWEDLEDGMRRYREAGGKRAILANVIVDLVGRPETASRGLPATITLTGSEDEVRQRLRRLRDIGFDDVLCVSPAEALEDIERVRDLA